MPLSISSRSFAARWRKDWQNKACTEGLLSIMEPFFKQWEHMLTDPGSEKDINFISLCHLLESQGVNPTAAMEEWIHYADNTTSIREELVMLFLTQMSKMRYYPTKASSRMVEYVLARDFKQRLCKEILKASRHPIDMPVKEVIFTSIPTPSLEKDILLIKHLGLTDWQWYLLELLRQGKSSLEIAKITHIPRETFYYEEREIWQRLRQIWLIAEH
jgi:hypothetical protein